MVIATKAYSTRGLTWISSGSLLLPGQGMEERHFRQTVLQSARQIYLPLSLKKNFDFWWAFVINVYIRQHPQFPAILWWWAPHTTYRRNHLTPANKVFLLKKRLTSSLFFRSIGMWLAEPTRLATWSRTLNATLINQKNSPKPSYETINWKLRYLHPVMLIPFFRLHCLLPKHPELPPKNRTSS